MQGRDALVLLDDHTPQAALKQGDQGDAVWLLQHQLARLGYHDIDARLRTDGRFGERTRRAVEAFQYDYGLLVDGIVGPRTHAALKHADCAHRTFEQRRHVSPTAYDTGSRKRARETTR
jgi:peptidoglycan hydrolase-like protein with peptidoglycan-binding domain